MDDVSWVPNVLAVAVSMGALAYAAFAHRMAKRAEERAERADRLTRIQLELVRNPAEVAVFALRNTGTETAQGVKIDPASVVEVEFRGSLYVDELIPGVKSYPFALGPEGVAPKLRDALRVTWTAPFPGEQYVPLPPDPDEQWSYTLPGSSIR